MNTRRVIKIEENEQNFIFYKMSEENEKIFRNYIEMSRHFQEITQLYRMMLFDLDDISKQYVFHFDDRVIPLYDKELNILYVNRIIRNAVSSARTLIESMEIFEREYIDSEGYFKINFISRTYDEYFSYRFIDFIRNYLQHGHVPISFDGEKIFFQLSEILDVTHMRINSSLKKQMKNIEHELLDYGDSNIYLTVVPMCYEYFLLVQVLILEFLRFIKGYLLEHFNKVQEILEENGEYVLDINGIPFVAVYLDEERRLHGFSAEDNMEREMDYWIDFAEQQLQQYEKNNNHIIFLNIKYCLENRMPIMNMVTDDVLSENLEEYCLKIGTGIHFLSFDKYYGKMEMNAVYRFFPYIQFEDGVRWNVPYQEVTIADFVRTFPQVRKEGLKVFANNVGGAGDFIQSLMQDWSGYIYGAKAILTNIGIGSPIDLLDWASRIVFVWQGMQWIEKSFSKSKKQKPFIRDLRNYIQQRKEWNLVELEKNLHAHQELLRIVLEEQGYVCRDGMIYRYDKTIAEKLEQERNAFLEKRYDNHGTNVNCFEMNVAVEQLNVDLLYFAVLEKECNKLEEYDEKVKELLAPLKECGPYIIWDDLDRSIQIAKNIPKSFCEKDLELIWQCVKEVDERVLVEANKLENER